MSRIRLIMLSLFAMFAMSAVASASASAAECPDTEKGGDYAVCVEGKEYEGKLANKNTAVASVLEGEVLGFETKLTGTTAKAEITAEDSGKSKGSIEFTKITVVKPAKCVVKEPVVATFTDQLSTPPAAITDTFTGNKEFEEGGKKVKEVFTEIEFKNKGTEACPLNGKTFPVRGSQVATFDANIGLEQELHEVTATKANSKLFLGPNKASFEATFKEVGVLSAAKVFTKEKWSIKES